MTFTEINAWFFGNHQEHIAESFNARLLFLYLFSLAAKAAIESNATSRRLVFFEGANGDSDTFELRSNGSKFIFKRDPTTNRVRVTHAGLPSDRVHTDYREWLSPGATPDANERIGMIAMSAALQSIRGA